MDKNLLKNNNLKTIVYFILQFLVIACMINQFLKGNYENTITFILTLILFMIPAFISNIFNIKLPNTLEIVILLFIFAAEILGEINGYYTKFEAWDTMLHTINGFLTGAIGVGIINILNNNKSRFLLSTLILVSFCFSMTIGIIWEFFEFGMDYIFSTDAQKDTFISSITSDLLSPNGHKPLTVQFESVVINGGLWLGYIDIGLYDTMKDLFANFLGAIIFSIIYFLYIKGYSNFAKFFIPIKK